MFVIVAFHALLVLLGMGMVSGAIPPRLVSDVLALLHNTIGITTPPLERTRMFALIWIGSTIVVFDGCLFLLVFITKMLN